MLTLQGIEIASLITEYQVREKNKYSQKRNRFRRKDETETNFICSFYSLDCLLKKKYLFAFCFEMWMGKKVTLQKNSSKKIQKIQIDTFLHFFLKTWIFFEFFSWNFENFSLVVVLARSRVAARKSSAGLHLERLFNAQLPKGKKIAKKGRKRWHNMMTSWFVTLVLVGRTSL